MNQSLKIIINPNIIFAKNKNDQYVLSTLSSDDYTIFTLKECDAEIFDLIVKSPHMTLEELKHKVLAEYELDGLSLDEYLRMFIDMLLKKDFIKLG